MEAELKKKGEKQELKELKLKTKKLELKLKQMKAREIEDKHKKSLLKSDENSGNIGGQFGTNAEPRKSLSTYLRNQNKAEISIVSILDRKAAILIRICTTLISGLVVFQGYIEENVSHGHLISHILMAGLTITLICAILATKPAGRLLRRIYKNRIQEEHANLEENIFLLTDANISLHDYEEAMSKVVKSQNLQLGNQIRANYVLAVNNVLKARILDVSYSIFLCTFVVIGIAYVVCKFM